MENSKYWYFSSDGEQKSRVTEDEIKSLIREGRINETTLLWTEGFASWKPLSEIDELANSSEMPPPLPGPEKKQIKNEIPTLWNWNKKILVLVLGFLLLIIAMISINVDFRNIISNLINGNMSVEKIAEQSSSVLMLEVYDDSNQLMATGSGFLISKEGNLVTNYHVIDKGFSIKAVSDSDVKYEIEGVVGYNAESDIAILKINSSSKLSPLKVGDSETVKKGDAIVAIGSPQGLKNTVSSGLISAIREDRKTKDLQISAPISHGSSGGALFNMRGEIIGITYAGLEEGQNLNFAIPINEVKEIKASDTLMTFEDINILEHQKGNSASNVQNGGKAMMYKGSIYYINEKDQGIYRSNANRDQEIRISDIEAGELNVFKDWIYYRNMKDAGRLYRVKIDGTENQPLSKSTQVSDILFNEKIVAYTSRDDKGIDLYTMAIEDLKERKVMKLGVFGYLEYLTEANILFLKNYSAGTDGTLTGLLSIDLNNNTITKISGSTGVCDITVKNGEVYYLTGDPSDSISKVVLAEITEYSDPYANAPNQSLSKEEAGNYIRSLMYGHISTSGQASRVSNEFVNNANYGDDGWIYFSDPEGRIKKMKYDGADVTLIDVAIVDSFIKVGNYLYCTKYKEKSNEVFWVKIKN